MDLVNKYYKRNFFVLAVCIVFASISFQIIMPFLPVYLHENMSLTVQRAAFWTGLIFSMQSFAIMIANPIWGKVGDTYGRKIMILRAGTVISLMFIALYFCIHPVQILVVRFVNGFFTGFIPATIALISTNTPKDKVLKYVAAAQTCQAVGQLFGPSLGGFLFSAMGFRNTCLVSFGLVAFITLMVVFFVKEINKPEKPEIKTNILSDLKEIVNFKNQKQLLFLAFIFGVSIQAALPFVTIHLKHISDLPAWAMGCIYAIPAVSMILTAQFWSRTGKNKGFVNVLKFATLTLALIYVLMGIWNNVIWFCLSFFMFGIFLAAMRTNITARTVAEIEDDYRGRVLSVQDSFMTFGGAVAPLTVGIVAERFSTNTAFITMGIFIFISAAICFTVLKNK